MDSRKRKWISDGIVTRSKAKQRKIVEAEVDTVRHEKTLKMNFTRVRKSSEDEPSIYRIKEPNEVPISSEAQIMSTNDDPIESMNSTMIIDQIPDFTDFTAFDDLFTDLKLFIENNNFDEADILALSSTPDYPILSTADVVDNVNTTSHKEDLTVPVDLTTEKTPANLTTEKTPADLTTEKTVPVDSTTEKTVPVDSTTEKTETQNLKPSKFVPIDSLSARIEAYINTMEHEVPTANSTCYQINGPRTLTSDRECSSTNRAATPSETITRNYTFCTEKSRATRPKLIKLFKSPATNLEEILDLQGIQLSYEFLPLTETHNSKIQCRVWFNNHYGAINAYGSGSSTRDAKNCAATSLLDKLVSNKYFGNIIGQLQEFCIARKWSIPKYGDETEVRSKNGSTFIWSCSVKQHTEFGQGKNKKMAKIFAAYRMLSHLTTK